MIIIYFISFTFNLVIILLPFFQQIHSVFQLLQVIFPIPFLVFVFPIFSHSHLIILLKEALCFLMVYWLSLNLQEHQFFLHQLIICEGFLDVFVKATLMGPKLLMGLLMAMVFMGHHLIMESFGLT